MGRSPSSKSEHPCSCSGPLPISRTWLSSLGLVVALSNSALKQSRQRAGRNSHPGNRRMQLVLVYARDRRPPSRVSAAREHVVVEPEKVLRVVGGLDLGKPLEVAAEGALHPDVERLVGDSG